MSLFYFLPVLKNQRSKTRAFNFSHLLFSVLSAQRIILPQRKPICPLLLKFAEFIHCNPISDIGLLAHFSPHSRQSLFDGWPPVAMYKRCGPSASWPLCPHVSVSYQLIRLATFSILRILRIISIPRVNINAICQLNGSFFGNFLSPVLAFALLKFGIPNLPVPTFPHDFVSGSHDYSPALWMFASRAAVFA